MNSPTDALSGRLAARPPPTASPRHQRARSRTSSSAAPGSGPCGDGIRRPAAPRESGRRAVRHRHRVEKRYLGAVTASGAAVGSAALLPGIGTLAALSAAAGETAVFLEATAFFALAIAAVHGVPSGEPRTPPRPGVVRVGWRRQQARHRRSARSGPEGAVRGCRRGQHRCRCPRWRS